MSYVLCIWDPTEHLPMPTDAAQAAEAMTRLSTVPDVWNSRLSEFGQDLFSRYQADAAQGVVSTSLEKFWGSDPRTATNECRSVVFRLTIPADECVRQIVHVVEAAGALGFVAFDDEVGMCFLPNGTVFPEDSREMWEDSVAELKAGPPDPTQKQGDGRTFLERLGGELLDAISRGNRRG